MSGEQEQHLGRPVMKNEINLSTIALAIGMVATAGGAIFSAGQMASSLEGAQAASAQERSIIRSDVAKVATAVDSLQKLDGKYDNIAYRVTVQEQATAAAARATEELKRSMSEQQADIRVIREILTRLDQRAEK